MSRGNRACRTRMHASDLSARTSHACGARGIWRTTRPADSTKHRTRPPANPARGKLNGDVDRRPRSILVRMPRVSARMSRGHAARKLLPWNVGLTELLHSVSIVHGKQLNGETVYLAVTRDGCFCLSVQRAL